MVVIEPARLRCTIRANQIYLIIYSMLRNRMGRIVHCCQVLKSIKPRTSRHPRSHSPSPTLITAPILSPIPTLPKISHNPWSSGIPSRYPVPQPDSLMRSFLDQPMDTIARLLTLEGHLPGVILVKQTVSGVTLTHLTDAAVELSV